MLKELLDNSSYKSYFARRLSCHLFTSFHPERMKLLIDGHVADIEAELPAHIARWEGAFSSYGNAIPSEDYWRTQVGNLKTFVEARPQALLNDLQSYGFDATANLALAVFPEDAGTIKMDGLIVPGSQLSAPFLKNIPVELLAESKPGFEFIGWASSQKQDIMPRGAEWLFLDTGTDPGEGWTNTDFNDESWSSGNAELGYGDGDESTIVAYGVDPSDKFMTTYFRKTFNITEEQLNADHYFLDLLKDDGAVVYLNGTEIVRANMAADGEINNQSPASETVQGDAESTFSSYPIDLSLIHIGENLLAVEVHQNESSSSDLSFDLGLYAQKAEGQSISWASETYPLNIDSDFSLTALFESTGSCILPELVDGDIEIDDICLGQGPECQGIELAG